MSQSTPDFDPYEELEVARHASTPTIGAAYRSLAKRHHPDTVSTTADADAKMKRLNLARDILTDPARRAAYDGTRSTAARPPEPKPTPKATRPKPTPKAPEPTVGGGTCRHCGEAFETAGGLTFHYRFSGCAP